MKCVTWEVMARAVQAGCGGGPARGRTVATAEQEAGPIPPREARLPPSADMWAGGVWLWAQWGQGHQSQGRV